MDHRSAFALDVALIDPNVQAVLKTMLIEVDWLLDEYDMRDTIFGEKLAKLIKDWYPE